MELKHQQKNGERVKHANPKTRLAINALCIRAHNSTPKVHMRRAKSTLCAAVLSVPNFRGRNRRRMTRRSDDDIEEMEKAKGKRSAPRGRRAEWGDGTPQERSAENVPFGLLAEFCPLRKLSHASCLFNATECNWLCTGKVTKHATAQRAQPSAFSDTRPECLACLIATQFSCGKLAVSSPTGRGAALETGAAHLSPPAGAFQTYAT